MNLNVSASFEDLKEFLTLNMSLTRRLNNQLINLSQKAFIIDQSIALHPILTIPLIYFYH